jgi:flagellar hook protein FlgE
MMQAMRSGVSSLKAHQTKMDVIAHNVANVNTNDFKSSRVDLQDSFSQTIQRARAANTETGVAGANPMQVGSGVSVASISRSDTPGARIMAGDTTEVMSNTDLAVEMTNMIVTQRGFEANARVIPVVDEMLQEVSNLRA